MKVLNPIYHHNKDYFLINNNDMDVEGNNNEENSSIKIFFNKLKILFVTINLRKKYTDLKRSVRHAQNMEIALAHLRMRPLQSGCETFWFPPGGYADAALGRPRTESSCIERQPRILPDTGLSSL